MAVAPVRVRFYPLRSSCVNRLSCAGKFTAELLNVFLGANPSTEVCKNCSFKCFSALIDRNYSV